MSLDSYSELEKKNYENEQASVDNSEIEKKITVEQQKQNALEHENTLEQQKQNAVDVSVSTTETLLASLDKEITKNVYTEKTKKEMLSLRDDIASGSIDEQTANEKLSELTQTIDSKESDKESKWRWKAMKWTGLVALGGWLSSRFNWKKIEQFFGGGKSNEKPEESNNGKETGPDHTLDSDQSSNPDQTLDPAQSQHVADVSENSQEPVSVGENPPVGENIDEAVEESGEGVVEEINNQDALLAQYEILKQSNPNFDEAFLQARAVAIVNQQGYFEQNDKKYYCYEIDGKQGITADINKYEQILIAEREKMYEDLPDDSGDVLSEQEQQEVDQANEEVEKLEKEGVNWLYILMRMYQNGFMPSKAFGFRKIDAVLDSQWNARVWLQKKMLPSVRHNLILAQAINISGMSDVDYKTTLETLKKIDVDITNGEITSLKDLNAKYGKDIEVKLRWTQKIFSGIRRKQTVGNAQQEVKRMTESYTENEKAILELEESMNKSKQEVMKKLDDLKKQAETTTDSKAQKALLDEIQKTTDDYNLKSVEYQKQTGKIMAGMTDANLMKIETRSSMVKTLLKNAGGRSAFLQKVNRGGGKMMLGVSVFALAQRAGADIQSQGVVSWETAKDAGDLTAGMIPFVGGGYDVFMAIKGKDWNGREMSAADRWIRAGMGVGTTALDILGLFSFGAGNAAAAGIRGTYKGIRAFDKVVDVAKTTSKIDDAAKLAKGAKGLANTYKSLRLGMEVATFGMLGYGVYQGTADFVVDIAKPAAIGIAKKIEEKNTATVSV